MAPLTYEEATELRAKVRISGLFSVPPAIDESPWQRLREIAQKETTLLQISVRYAHASMALGGYAASPWRVVIPHNLDSARN